MNVYGVNNLVAAAMRGAISWIAWLVQDGYGRSDILQRIGRRFVVGPGGLDVVTPSLSQNDAINLYNRGRRAAVAGLELSSAGPNWKLSEGMIPVDPDLRPGVYQYEMLATWRDSEGKKRGFSLPISSYGQLTAGQAREQFVQGAAVYAAQHGCPAEFDPQSMPDRAIIQIVYIRKGGNYA